MRTFIAGALVVLSVISCTILSRGRKECRDREPGKPSAGQDSRS